jgi:hypothetical protein
MKIKFVCPECRGNNGYWPFENDCEWCHNTGMVGLFMWLWIHWLRKIWWPLSLWIYWMLKGRRKQIKLDRGEI